MTDTLASSWQDCIKLLPYRDFRGDWRFPNQTQKRTAIIDGNRVVQFRERAETETEFLERTL